MLYFAYGSNLDWSQMQQRCPSAHFIAAAQLTGHRLAFTRKSTGRGCGVADAVVDATSEVWGAVFQISEIDIGPLDKSEGYRPGRSRAENSYLREERHVIRDGDRNSPLLVSVYFGIPQSSPPKPNAGYKRLIVEGARHWKLPTDYIALLERIETHSAGRANNQCLTIRNVAG